MTTTQKRQAIIRKAFESGAVIEFRFAGMIFQDTVRSMNDDSFSISAMFGPGTTSYTFDEIRGPKVVG